MGLQGGLGLRPLGDLDCEFHLAHDGSRFFQHAGYPLHSERGAVLFL